MLIESKRRSVFKAISWRVLATLTTMLIVYTLTGKFELTFIVGGFDVVLKILIYYFHERLWTRVHWGKSRYKPFVLWLTGLSGSGKSTLACAICEQFKKLNMKFETLDGDVVRNVFPKTGFSKDDRNMHIRRVGFLAGMLEKNGVPVICSFISPYRESRQFVRENTERFVEVFVNASLSICEERDPKGLYKKARAGEIKQFTGVDDPYEAPLNPELNINTGTQSVEDCAAQVMKFLKERQYIL